MSSPLAFRCAEIEAELQAWQALTAEGQPLIKHRSQVAALSRMFGDAAKRLGSAAMEAAAPLDGLLQDEVDLWRVWSVFQVPLLQRRHPRYADPLSLADGFAWSCYRPAAARAVDPALQARVLEPPLVFCEPTASPSALTRGSSLAREVAGGDDALLERLRRPEAQIMIRLPVPLVAIPWGCLGFLPDLLLVAHEVGHLADGDFGIAAAVCEALPDLLAPASPWFARVQEVIADVYGALAGGVPFLKTLARILAPVVAAEAQGVAPARSYPPAAWRLAAVGRALLAQGTPTAELPPLPLTGFAGDDVIDAVTDAVCTTALPRLGGCSLLQAFADPAAVTGGYGKVLVPAQRRKEVKIDCDRLVGGQPPGSSDLVVLLGALAEASTMPRLPDLAEASRRVVRRSLTIEPTTSLSQRAAQDAVFVKAEFDLLQGLRDASMAYV